MVVGGRGGGVFACKLALSVRTSQLSVAEFWFRLFSKTGLKIWTDRLLSVLHSDNHWQTPLQKLLHYNLSSSQNDAKIGNESFRRCCFAVCNKVCLCLFFLEMGQRG